MAGTLYGIGVGPGDPELVTFKAARVLREVPVVAVPVAREDGESYALDIVSALLQPGQEVLKLHFPMCRDVHDRRRHRLAAAEAVSAELRAGRSVGFVTEGDPLVHSTFIYLLQHLPTGHAVEIIPGVSSITAAAANAALPLVNGDQRLAVVPVASIDPDELRLVLAEFDTVVLLKLHRVLDPLLDLLDELGLAEGAVLVERASHKSGRVVRNVRSLRGSPLNYLSVLIVRGGRSHRVE